MPEDSLKSTVNSLQFTVRGVDKGLVNVLTLEVGIRAEDCFLRLPSGQQTQQP